MKKRNGFTFVEFVASVAIISLMAIIFGAMVVTKNNERFQNLGRKIDSPIISQVYLVTAVDTEMNLVIAMPYKVSDDKGATKTDRRLLLRVTNKAINEKDIWFVKSADGIENIISSPFLKFVSAQKTETKSEKDDHYYDSW